MEITCNICVATGVYKKENGLRKFTAKVMLQKIPLHHLSCQAQSLEICLWLIAESVKEPRVIRHLLSTN